jgi:hypothetical protein
MEIYELGCKDSGKSFYGKAHVICMDNGDKILQSYNTKVCKVSCDASGKHFHKLWDDYSATTMRHINSFVDEMGIAGGGKAWWDGLKCE